METLTNIKVGDLTDKGIVKMVDNPWKDSDGNVVDRIVTTTKGTFRETQLTLMEKAPKPIKGLKDEIDFQTAISVDIRPGTVSLAKRVPKSDKLIHLIIDTNLGKKNVVTNLGDTYEPEEFVGKRLLFIMNMKPVKMMGVLSEAMILAGDEFKFNVDGNIWEEKTELFILK